MKFQMEHNWYNSYPHGDLVFLEDSLNWDNVFELATSEYDLFSVLTISSFLNTHYFIDWVVKLSSLDVLLINDIDSLQRPQTLFLGLVSDCVSSFSSTFFSLPLLFYTDFQDFIAASVFYCPELVVGQRQAFAMLWAEPTFNTTPAAVFDSYQDVVSTDNAEFSEYLKAFWGFIAPVIGIIVVTRLVTLSNSLDTYVTRAYYYLYSMSTEVRFQFEAALQVFFFFFLFTSMAIATFDDDQEELLEFFNSMCFYFFLFTFVYYLFKYSIHFFSFLEAAKVGSKSASPVSQFMFDMLNTVALGIRFLVLMARLNIYDGVDDVLDSYYIFMADFEEEEYFPDMFFSLFSVMSFDTDVNDDRSFLFEDEMDFSADLFTLYFLVWGKFAYFWMFILEEIARVTLALYVTYLVIFEINAVNRSYSEDTYLASKRVSSGVSRSPSLI